MVYTLTAFGSEAFDEYIQAGLYEEDEGDINWVATDAAVDTPTKMWQVAQVCNVLGYEWSYMVDVIEPDRVPFEV